MELKVGLDLGNYDTKTQNSITPSSFMKIEGKKNANGQYEAPSLVADEILFFEGNYYVPTTERNHQETDKTQNDYCTIISLIGIAKEIIYQIKQNNNCYNANSLQKAINEVKEVRLGVGLPIGYFSNLAKPTLDYYNKRFIGGASFSFISPDTNGSEIFFNIKFTDIRMVPQDAIAVLTSKTLSIPQKYSDYNVIGMGGGTCDIIEIRDGKPNLQTVISKEAGTTHLYSEVSKKLQQNRYPAKDNNIIEKVLRDMPTVIKEDEKNFIKKCAVEYATNLTNKLVQEGIKFNDYPTVFIGGGALLLKPYWESRCGDIVEYCESVNENAICYAKAV